MQWQGLGKEFYETKSVDIKPRLDLPFKRFGLNIPNKNIIIYVFIGKTL